MICHTKFPKNRLINKDFEIFGKGGKEALIWENVQFCYKLQLTIK